MKTPSPDRPIAARPRRPRPLGLWLTALALLGVLACAALRSSEPVPRQGWAEAHGIVVPHDEFPADCRLCHEGEGWNAIRADFHFDHELKTGVALEGTHDRATCLRCHNDRGPVALFASRGCQGCHEDFHQGTLGFNCVDCHGQETWRLLEEVAVHNRTRFPLVGAHAAAACWACHPGGEVGNWVRMDIECAACHGADTAAALDPDHTALGWTFACDRCHIPTTWTGAGFNHSFFALTGAHTVLDCDACHTGGAFAGLPTDCSGCHMEEFQGVTDPNHVLGGFPMVCELCHDTGSWEGAMFSHAGIASGCATCHQDDYDQASDPDHLAGGFPIDCEACHGTQTWQGALFDHAGTTNGCAQCHLDDYTQATDPDHQLLGISTNCEECHGTDTWQGALFDHAGIRDGCAQCHLDTYAATSDPNHTAAGFPTDCEACHATNAWQPADFNHAFPINGGDHQNLSCSDCHQNPGAYSVFTCTSCHEHSQGEMAGEHEDVRRYVWQSSQCYSCHPTGQE